MPTPTTDDEIIRTARAEMFRLETLVRDIKDRVKAEPAYAEVILPELRGIRQHLMTLRNFNRPTEEDQ